LIFLNFDHLFECVAHDCPAIMRKVMPATLSSAFSYGIMDRKVSEEKKLALLIFLSFDHLLECDVHNCTVCIKSMIPHCKQHLFYLEKKNVRLIDIVICSEDLLEKSGNLQLKSVTPDGYNLDCLLALSPSRAQCRPYVIYFLVLVYSKTLGECHLVYYDVVYH